MAASSPARSMGVSAPTTPMASASNNSYEDDLRHKIFEGQLNKFTNVVKGWQYR
jgi:hypothetical protein